MAPVGRRMRANAATASDRRVIAAFEARDLDALADAFADDYAESIVSAAPAMITRSEMLAGLRTPPDFNNLPAFLQLSCFNSTLYGNASIGP